MARDNRYDHALHVRSSQGQILIGAILLLLGTAMLLDNLDVIQIGSIWHHWPALIIILGIGKFLQAESPRERISAFWFMFIGAWLYISVFRLFGLSFHDSWPLLLVGLGASMVMRSSLATRRQEEGVPHE
jgi:LiaF transmembrane domain